MDQDLRISDIELKLKNGFLAGLLYRAQGDDGSIVIGFDKLSPADPEFA
jgi:hypothetical protein